MAARRVVRSEKSSLVSGGISQPSPQPSISYFRRLLGLLWSCIKVLWYWIERIVLIGLLLVLTVGLGWWLSREPSLYRDWLPAESILPTVSFSGTEVRIENVRNHNWSSSTEFTPGFYDATYNLDDIMGLYYIITPFSDIDGVAHTMFSFSFSGGKNLIISPEARKERGESFDALVGMLNQFEIMYVIADESDSLKLRTNYRKNEVYMYPIEVEKEKIQGLFRSILIRADKLAREPEFYNTLWNNCATALLTHANAFRVDKLQAGSLTLLPSYSDKLIYDAGLIDTKLPLEEARVYYRIDDIAEDESLSGSTFSERIRKERK